MASHQTFSRQINISKCPVKANLARHLLYIINGNFMEFVKENECPDNFQSLS